MTITYYLERFMTTEPQPSAIWATDGVGYRCVAMLTKQADATQQEADAMLAALKTMQSKDK